MRALVLLLLTCLAGTASADTPTYLCKDAAPDTKLSVSFSAQVSLQELATWVLGFSCKNIVIANDVAKHATKMTIMAPKQMTPKQAMQLFVDAVEANGLVVVQKPDSILIKLGPNLPKNCPDLAVAPRAPTTWAPISVGTPPAEEDTDDALQKAIDTGIKKISDTQYEIKKTLIAKVLENPMVFAKGARVVPAMKNGKPQGFKLYAIRPNGSYARLGLINGDTLVGINGFALTTADKALEIYTSLRDATKLEVSLLRRDKPVTLTYVIK